MAVAEVVPAVQEKKPDLFSLGIEGAEIESILIDAEGELTPELEVRLDAFLSSGKDKMDKAARYVRHLASEIKFCKDEATRMSDRAKSLEKQQKSLKGRMLFCLQTGFAGKLKTSINTFFVGKAAAAIVIGLAPDADMNELEKSSPAFVNRELSINNEAVKLHYATTDKCPLGFTYDVLPRTEFLGMR